MCVPTIAELLRIVGDPAASIEDRARAGDELAALGDPRVVGEGRLLVPAGFVLSKPSRESVGVTIAVAAFGIARFPVTVADYARFIDEGGYDDASHWSNDGWRWRIAEGADAPRFWGADEWAPYLVKNHPVVGVSAYEAEAYASFRDARLPTELEWERACRGDDGRDFPWGEAWDEHAASHRDYGPRATVAVGCFPRGASPCGAHDLVGHVWQWTADDQGDARIVRGGAWNNLPWSIGCCGRNAYPRTARFSNLGFRLAW